jgi:hypothetical protein
MGLGLLREGGIQETAKMMRNNFTGALLGSLGEIFN